MSIKPDFTKDILLKCAKRYFLFNTQMVKAILNGDKTQTRRIISPKDLEELLNTVGDLYTLNPIDENHKCYYTLNVGNILYIRETFAKCDCGECEDCKELDGLVYRADFDENGWHKNELYTCHEDEIRFTPSIHMAKKFARLFIEITGVRVERLQDISSEDIYNEGMSFSDTTRCDVWFRELWDSTVSKKDYKWDANPWVIVYEFKVLEYAKK
jgi:uncharacterized protein YhfF